MASAKQETTMPLQSFLSLTIRSNSNRRNM